jgi:hypothetical protein
MSPDVDDGCIAKTIRAFWPCYTRKNYRGAGDSVNEAIGKLRLLELEPLKLAIMDALQRAWSFMPPLHVQSKEAHPSSHREHGFEPRPDLRRAIDCLAIDDTPLRELCHDFQSACEDAGRRWFDARQHAATNRLDSSIAGTKHLYAQPPYDGERAVAHIRDLYIKLSQHIERVLR